MGRLGIIKDNEVNPCHFSKQFYEITVIVFSLLQNQDSFEDSPHPFLANRFSFFINMGKGTGFIAILRKKLVTNLKADTAIHVVDCLTNKIICLGLVFCQCTIYYERPFLRIADHSSWSGIRIKLNKFSGANLCVDYEVGIKGQQVVSVKLAEVF